MRLVEETNFYPDVFHRDIEKPDDKIGIMAGRRFNSVSPKAGGGVTIGIVLVVYAIFVALFGKGKIDKSNKKGDDE